jgi:hypothetical protein
MGISAPEARIKTSSQDRSLEIELRIQIANSFVHIACDLNKYDPTDFDYLFKLCLDFTRVRIDLISFAMGMGFTVALESFVRPDGTFSQIVPQDPQLTAACKSIGVTRERVADFEKVFGIVATEPLTFRTLNDMISTLTFPYQAPATCGRIVETLRTLVAGADAPPKTAWPLLRETLRASDGFIRAITEAGSGGRKGEPAFVPGSVATDLTRRTWLLVDRYFEFRKRNSGPLPEAEFPVLG